MNNAEIENGKNDEIIENSESKISEKQVENPKTEEAEPEKAVARIQLNTAFLDPELKTLKLDRHQMDPHQLSRNANYENFEISLSYEKLPCDSVPVATKIGQNVDLCELRQDALSGPEMAKWTKMQKTL